MVKNKSGISAIVATVLIILITVAGVTIIWAAVIPMINDRVTFNEAVVDLSIQTDGGYTTWDESTKIASVQIKRGSDDSSTLDGIQVIFGMPGGVSIPFWLNASEIPTSNQAKVYYFNLSEKPLDVKIAPIFDGVVGEISSKADYLGVATQSPGVGSVVHNSDGSGGGSGTSTVECSSGDIQLCPNQEGVCSEFVETCVNGMWLGCDYSSIDGYEEGRESSCEDGIDNDCDGYADCDDCDCFDGSICSDSSSCEPDGNWGASSVCGDEFCNLNEECSEDCPTELISVPGYEWEGCYDNANQDEDGDYSNYADCDCFSISGNDYSCYGGAGECGDDICNTGEVCLEDCGTEDAGEYTCMDGTDNDNDGLFDCEDIDDCVEGAPCTLDGNQVCTSGDCLVIFIP